MSQAMSKAPPRGESYLIRKYFQRAEAATVRLGIGDDAAIIDCDGARLVVSADTMVEGSHFFKGDAASDIGYKALATAASDLAAMGTQPQWALLCLSLPSNDENWVKGFAEGFFEMAGPYAIALIGGDMTRGPLSCSVQVMGTTSETCMRRDAALSGHGIYLTGHIAMAGFANQHAQALAQQDPKLLEQCTARYKRPEPRITESQIIAQYAPCAIDISDGVLMDLSRILEASDKGAEVALDQMPFAAGFERYCPDSDTILKVLSHGEDYELLFTMDDAHYPALQKAWGNNPLPLTRIGTITEQPDMRCTYKNQAVELPELLGYDHFASP